MDKAGKIAASTLTVIIVMSCLALSLVKPVNSQSMSKPSLPEFSLDNVNVSASAAPSAQSTPYEVLPSSTFATPQTYYSVPPLSSLSLKIDLARGCPCSFSVYIKGGSGNDLNLRIINPEGRIIYDLGRISNETSFKFYADKPGNYTIILDNEFSVFSAKGVNVYQGNITFSTFEFAVLSINFWVILTLIISSLVVLMTFVVWLRKRRKYNLIGKH